MKYSPASLGGWLKSKPTWPNTFGCSATSAFLFSAVQDGRNPSTEGFFSVQAPEDNTMLFLAQSLLTAAGFEYDEIEESWVARMPLSPLVAIECDEDRAYIREALMEVHASLDAIGCVYNNFVVNTCFVSIDGPRQAMEDKDDPQLVRASIVGVVDLAVGLPGSGSDEANRLCRLIKTYAACESRQSELSAVPSRC